MNVSDVTEFVSTGGENRHQELKQSVSWKDDKTKFKITKAILAMSNIQNGGRIIIGVAERNGKYYPEGMTESHYLSFNQDDVCDYVGKYADPYVRFRLHKIDDASKSFVVIKVEEFEETPVICKKYFPIMNQEGEQKVPLQSGDIYTRTSGSKPQSSRVMSYLDLREIVNLAIQKGVRSYIKQSNEAGLSANVIPDQTDEQKFNEQLKDFL
jgi:predicted HTH transcriptional regulator